MYLNLGRAELENQLEDDFKRFAESVIGDHPDELKKANDFNPAFFSGLFPHMGIEVVNTSGRSRVRDKPNRPGQVSLTLYIYDAAMPQRGARSRDQDRTSRAKKRCRLIREQILEEMYKTPGFAAAAEVRETRSSIYNDFGFPMLDVAGSNILWVDRTDIVIGNL